MKPTLKNVSRFLLAFIGLTIAVGLYLNPHAEDSVVLLADVLPAVAVTANKRLVALDEKRSKLLAKMEKILNEADGDDLSEEQQKAYDEADAEYQKIDAQFKREEALEARKKDGGTRLKLDLANDGDDPPDPMHTRPRWEDDPNVGYRVARDFLLDVMECTKTKQVSDRLKFLASAGSDEQSGQSDPYGSFFLPEGFSTQILSVRPDGDPTNPTQIPMTTMSVSINARVDKNHTASVSGGLTVGRNVETQAPNDSRQKYEQVKLEVTEQAGVAYATNLLLQMSPVSFVALLQSGFDDEYAAQRLKEKIAGTGAGEPLGILNSPAKISVAKEGSQTADTIVGNNLIKMRARQWNYGRSIWIANHDTLTQLMAAHIAGTNTDNYLYAPGNGTDVPDTLLGRPIFFSEFAKTLGDEGDIMNVDWSQYLWATLGMLNRAESIHVRFLQGENTFKFWQFNDGQPWWKSALTPAESSTTLSPIVTLAERA